MSKIPVFDIGDTLVPSNRKINEVVQSKLKETGVENPPHFPMYEYNIYKTEDVEKWLEKKNFDADAEEITEAFLDWKKEFLLEEGVLESLRKIGEKFGPIGFISDNSIEAKEFYKKHLRDAGVNYRGLVVSEEIGATKPDLELFEAFLENRDEEPGNFVYFGNRADIDSASEKTGMNFVQVTGYDTFDTLSEGLKIDKISYSNVEKALREVEKQ